MKVQFDQSSYSTVGKKQLSCLCSVDEGTVPQINNSDTHVLYTVCVGGEWGGYLSLPIPLIFESHKLEVWVEAHKLCLLSSFNS